MDIYGEIKRRWQFQVPTGYQSMAAAGLFDHTVENYLLLSDTRWFSPRAILEYDPPIYVIDGLIPFAQQGNSDKWCWIRDKAIDGIAPVAFCPHDSNIATVYAPDFGGCIYRLLLEELSGTWLVRDGFRTPDRTRGPNDVSELLRRYGHDVAAFLPSKWIATLTELASHPLKPLVAGMYGVLTRYEAESILRRDFAFPLLDLEFMQHTDPQFAPFLSGFQKSIRLFGKAFSFQDIVRCIERSAIKATRWEIGDDGQVTETLVVGRMEAGVEAPVKIRYYPDTYYNPSILAKANLNRPSSLLMIVPIESKPLFIDILRQLVPLQLFILTHAGLMGLSEFLLAKENWECL